MNTLRELPFLTVGDEAVANAPADSWFVELRRARIDAPYVRTTGQGESCALLLTGTFDLRGAATQWQSRGARTNEREGRPVAVFLPPRTEFAATNGSGSILFVEARQPTAAPTIGRAALQQSPLLPLSGSGKSFDPTRGEWLPAESFPTAAESLPPRRIEQVRCGPVRVERVFAADYKAMSLLIDEAVVPAGATLDLEALPLPPNVREALIYIRSDQEITVHLGDLRAVGSGECVFYATGAIATLRIEASQSPCYLALACAPK